jgi:hypothetical protein
MLPVQVLEGPQLTPAAPLDELELGRPMVGRRGDVPCPLRRRHARVALPGSRELLTITVTFAIEFADPSARHDDPIGDQERTLQRLAAAISAQPSAGRDHAMAGDARRAAALHDVADGTRGARNARRGGDVAVGGDAAGRNPADGRKDTNLEIRGPGNLTSAALRRTAAALPTPERRPRPRRCCVLRRGSPAPGPSRPARGRRPRRASRTSTSRRRRR